MKKNITINLFGQLYNIDVDAYELLDNYQKNLKGYFARLDGGNEVAEDVENRVAELFAELKEQGVEAITIDHVKQIIDRIGDPQQMADADAETDGQTGSVPPPQPNGKPARRLFRDTEDKMLGGVLAGVAHYFGSTDPLPWRIIFLLLFFFSWTSLGIIYIVLWALIPEARTAEEKLQMFGKEVNAASIRDEVMRGVDATRSFVQSPGTRRQARSLFSTLLRAVLIIGGAVVGLVLLGLLLTLVVLIIGLLVVCFAGATAIAWGGPFEFMGEALQSDHGFVVWIWVMLIAALVVIAVPFVAVLRGLLRKPTDKSMSTGAKASLLACWFVALALGIVSFVFFVSHGEKLSQARWNKEHSEYLEENTRDGRYLTSDSWEYLSSSGWEIRTLDNADSDIVGWDDDPFEDGSIRYLRLKQETKSEPMNYELVKTISVRPGRYVLRGLARTDGQGNAFFARQDSTVLAIHEIDPHQVLATETQRDILSHVALVDHYAGQKQVEQAALDAVKEANWLPFQLEVSVPRSGVLEYGISNSTTMTLNPWQATRVAVAFINIERISD